MADTESEHIVLTGNNLNLQTVIPAARSTNAHFSLSKEAVDNIRKSRQWVDEIRKTGSRWYMELIPALAPRPQSLSPRRIWKSCNVI